MPPIFGPAGNSVAFYDAGYKSSQQMPAWLHAMGLGAYEYPCNKGVKIGKPAAEKLGAEARANGIRLSVHAPYYISLSSTEAEKRDNSVRYILQTLEAARNMGATRIVVHSGSCSKMSREKALAIATQTLRAAVQAADEAGFGDITICPETMGKLGQLGTLEEVLALCSVDERLLPTLDFGHLNARTMGGIKDKADYAAILDMVANRLGQDRMAVFHAHFSKIEYGAGGEKRHLTFEDTEYGPEFAPLAELIYERNLSPTIICESRDVMAEDALRMQQIYETIAQH